VPERKVVQVSLNRNTVGVSKEFEKHSVNTARQQRALIRSS
jgi:hypothetical protein